MTSFSRYLPLAILLAACGDQGADTDATTEAATTTTTTPTPNPSEPTSTSGPTTDNPTDDPTDDPTLYDLCRSVNVDGAALLEAQCMCQVGDGGFPDLASCLAEIGYSPEQEDCTCEVYAQYPETKAALDCVAPVQKSLLECVLAAGCDDVAGLEKCADTFYPMVNDCPDTASEIDAAVDLECLEGPPFLCGSGETIPGALKCDFNVDCSDGSDELECSDVFTCTNGTTIPDDFKCDGFLDCCEGESNCRDTSDEAGCPEFMCTSGESIPLPQKCDGADNCADASDELDCPIFTCGSGETIPEVLQCDGIPDCVDSSDELDCP